MNTIEQQLETLDRLAEHEDTIASLYTLYKEIFPRDAFFWSGLAIQEKQHKELLLHLRSAVKEGRGTLSLNRLKFETIDNSLAFVKQHIALGQQGKTKRRAAVDWALTIERLLLEENLPEELCAVTDRLTAETFNRLRQETLEHRRRLEWARRHLLNPFVFFLPLRTP